MKINKSDLQNALEKVRPGLASQDVIEQSTSFAFTGGNVLTYNDEISISHPVKGLDLTGAIKAQALYEFLNRVKKDEITIEVEEEQLIIKAGRAKAGLSFEQEVKLPIREEDNLKWKELPKNFSDALKFSQACCSSDMSRPALTCVHINKEAIEASDSYQIISYKLDKKMPIKNVLLPAASSRELCKYKIKEVAEEENWIHFKTEEGTIFSSRTVTDDFPDITPHLEIEGYKFTFPKNITEILERALVFAKKESDPGDFPMASVSIKDKRIKISAKNEYGWFEEEVRTKHEGISAQFLVGVEFLMDVLANLKDCVISENKIGFTGDDWEHIVAVSADEGE